MTATRTRTRSSGRGGSGRAGSGRAGSPRTSGRAGSGRAALSPPATAVVVVVGVLCAIGVLMVFSASSVRSVRDTGTSWSYAARQLVWLAVGCAVAVVASRIPPRVWRDRLGPVLMCVAVAGLAWLAASSLLQRATGTGLPFAIDVNGATRWIGVGGAQFQPSELVKPALVLWCARLLADPRTDLTSWLGLRPVLVAAAGTGALVVAGDDLGTTVLLGVVLLTLLLMAGAPWRVLGGVAGVMVAGAAAVLTLLEGFRMERIAAFLDPAAHAGGAGLQIRQAQIGLASGGLFGSGPGYSRAKWGFLPEAHTDFILVVLGEEFGLVGTLVVLALFGALIVAGCAIAMGTTDRFRRLVAIGITTWLGTQALINIGVAVGTLPTKGITLPFLSYGGSSLLVSLLGVGILLAMGREAPPAPARAGGRSAPVVDLTERRHHRERARSREQALARERARHRTRRP